jgi:hypothetical protein
MRSITDFSTYADVRATQEVTTYAEVTSPWRSITEFPTYAKVKTSPRRSITEFLTYAEVKTSHGSQ